MKPEEQDAVTSLYDEIKASDKEFAKYESAYGPLADFITDYEHQKGLKGLSQTEIAINTKTTQSAISRFETMKRKPTYDLLLRISQAIGDELFISPLGSVSFTLPYDLHDSARAIAEKRTVSVKTLLAGIVREALTRESFQIVSNNILHIDATDIKEKRPQIYPPSQYGTTFLMNQSGQVDVEGLAG